MPAGLLTFRPATEGTSMETSLDTYRELADKAQIAHALAASAEENGQPRTARVLRAGAIEFERSLYRQALEEIAVCGNARAGVVLDLMREVR